MPGGRAAGLLIAALAPVATAADTVPTPPGIECAPGFEGVRATVEMVAGMEWRQEGGYDVAALEAPGHWRLTYAFTAPGHPAHPAVTLRTQRRQVTDVWTSDSKGCGWGDRNQFTILMDDMKSGDTELTNASRLEAERRKAGQSPLGLTP